MTAKPVASPVPDQSTTPREKLNTAEPHSGQNTTTGLSLNQASSDTRGANRSVQLWFHRLGMLIFVSICAVVGVVLVILPWRPEWTDNHLLLSYPALRMFVTNSFVRGLCSGLGALDIWIGFSQAITYHEENRA